MVSLAILAAVATLLAACAASPASLVLPRADCQGVRDAIAKNKWPCNESGAEPCGFCCSSWLNLASVYGPPCHDGHGDFACPAGSEDYHCVAHMVV